MSHHLSVTRGGWENERLAAYLLSRLAFVASPLSVGDDVGTDFLCTLAQSYSRRDRDRVVREYLRPQNSFAIQVKSSLEIIESSSQIDYLMGLEIPFFVGVLDRDNATLAVYSGEYLPVLFSYKGKPMGLRIKLFPGGHEFSADKYFVHYGKRESEQYRVFFPHVLTLSVDDDAATRNCQRAELSDRCSRMLRNIAARTSNEYVFSVGASGTETLIMAGEGSETVFRDNLAKRLAEAFKNCEWILDQDDRDLDPDEFNVYRDMYILFQESDRELPQILTEIADGVIRRVPLCQRGMRRWKVE